MTTDYYPRLADRLLQDRLESAGAVLIEGPKWCGETSTAERQAKSALYMQDPDQRTQYLRAADLQPSLLLKGDVPRLLDEIGGADAPDYVVPEEASSLLQELGFPPLKHVPVMRLSYGVLTEVPVMPTMVKIANRTSSWFPKKVSSVHQSAEEVR